MKKLPLLLFPLLSSVLTEAQSHKNVQVTYTPGSTKQTINIVQFQHNHEKSVQKIWFGKQVNFCIDANPYLYDIYIASRQVNDEEITDSVASARFTNFAIGSLTKINKATEKAQTAQAQPKPQATTLPSKNKAINDVLPDNIVDSLKTQYNLPLSYATKSFSYYEQGRGLSNQEIKAKPAIIEILTDIEQKAKDEEDYKIKSAEFEAAAASFTASIYNLKEYVQPFDDMLLTVLSDNVTSDQIINRINEKFAIYPQIVNVDTFINTASYATFSYSNDVAEKFQTLKIEYQKLQDVVNDYKTKPAQFKYDSLQFVKYLEADSLVTQSNPEATAKMLTDMFQTLKNPNSFKHYFHPVVAQKDTLFYTVRLKPSSRYDSLFNLYGKPLYAIDSFEFPIPIKGAFKINFSIGAAFLQQSLRNSSYYFSPNKDIAKETDSIKIYQSNQTNKFRPVISAFAHAYLNLKWDMPLTPGLTIGLSTNPVELSDISYLLGGSVIFGHRNRFIATAGIAGASVDYLKGKYQTNRNYVQKQFTGVEESDLTEKAFKTGFFFGFSYNISSNR